MTIAEFSIISGSILLIFSLYKVTTMRLAIAAREPMVPVINEIVNDPNASDDAKCIALILFTESLNPSILPRSLFRSFSAKNKWTMDDVDLSDDHKKVLNLLTKKHFFRVNVIAGAHWYALLFFCFFIFLAILSVFTFGRLGGLKLINLFEKLIIDPVHLKHNSA